MLNKEKLINSINERISFYKQDMKEENKIRINELTDLLYVINKDCFNMDLNKEMEIELDTYIEENSGIWDLTDVKEFLLYHKDDIIKILQKL